MKPNTLKTIPSSNTNTSGSMNHARSTRRCAFMLLMIICFGLLPAAHAVNPAPDGCYPNFTTAEGCDALNSLTTGAGNTGLGWRSLFFDSTGSFNTGVGGGALALNNADSNTAVGAAALLLNSTGTENTAIGTDALVFNDTAMRNSAVGAFALFNNVDGDSNTAFGADALGANTAGAFNVAIGGSALLDNIDGDNNTAIGVGALSQATGNGHTVVGRLAGAGITTVNNNIVIGNLSGVHSVFGQISDRCFIANIFGAPVDGGDFAPVLVDSNGRLGTLTVAAGAKDTGGFYPHGGPRQAIPQGAETQAMLNRKVETLEGTVAQQQKQIATLTAQLKDQAAQIQKVSAQVQLNKSASKTVALDQ